MKPTVIQCFPNSTCNGGVTTWAVNLGRRLESDFNSILLVHNQASKKEHIYQLHKEDHIVKVPGVSAWLASAKDIPEYIPYYSHIICNTSVMFPNWSWGTWATAATLIASGNEKIRLIGVCHTDEDGYYELLEFYEPIIHKFICVSDTIENKLKDKIPNRLSDIVNLPYPVEYAKNDEYLNRNSSEALRITFAGRIQQDQKRVLDFIELARKLSQKEGKYTVRFVGRGPEELTLQKFFASYPSKNITATFSGLVDPLHMVKIWRETDVVILLSEREGMPIAMLEGMGQGAIPVVTNVSGCKDIIHHGENGFLCDVGDCESIANVLEKLYIDSHLSAQISNRARQTIKDKFSISSYDSSIKQLIYSCLASDPRFWPKYMPVAHKRSPIFNPEPMGGRAASAVLFLKIQNKISRFIFHNNC